MAGRLVQNNLSGGGLSTSTARWMAFLLVVLVAVIGRRLIIVLLRFVLRRITARAQNKLLLPALEEPGGHPFHGARHRRGAGRSPDLAGRAPRGDARRARRPRRGHALGPGLRGRGGRRPLCRGGAGAAAARRGLHPADQAVARHALPPFQHPRRLRKPRLRGEDVPRRPRHRRPRLRPRGPGHDREPLRLVRRRARPALLRGGVHPGRELRGNGRGDRAPVDQAPDGSADADRDPEQDGGRRGDHELHADAAAAGEPPSASPTTRRRRRSRPSSRTCGRPCAPIPPSTRARSWSAWPTSTTPPCGSRSCISPPIPTGNGAWRSGRGVNLGILRTFAARGVALAFPDSVIHLDGPVSRQLAAGAGGAAT